MKRFTETTKWDDPWFMDLPGKYKLFWLFICDRCDCAGAWQPNWKLAIAQIGESLEPAEVLRIFADRIIQLPDGKFWIKYFIRYQYGILSSECKPHQNVLLTLNNLNLDRDLWIPFVKGIQRSQEKKRKEKNSTEGEYEGKPKLTKYGMPLPASCSIRQSDGAVLDYTGRVMDINQIRAANKKTLPG